MPYQSDRRLYLTADKTRVVEHGDARAAFLLVGEDCLLSDADAERYGLTHLPYVEPEILPLVHQNLGNVDMLARPKLLRGPGMKRW